MVSFSFKVPFNEPYDSKQDMDDSLLIYLSHYPNIKMEEYQFHPFLC